MCVKNDLLSNMKGKVHEFFEPSHRTQKWARHNVDNLKRQKAGITLD